MHDVRGATGVPMSPQVYAAPEVLTGRYSSSVSIKSPIIRARKTKIHATRRRAVDTLEDERFMTFNQCLQ